MIWGEMIELLDRHEVPLQPVEERDQKISAIVPVHLGLTALPAEAKQGGLDVALATRTVAESFNEDMITYIECLIEQGYKIPDNLRGYEEFNPAWMLDAEPSNSGTGFLRLLWRQGDGTTHDLSHDPFPVIYRNQHNELGELYTPGYFEQRRAFPIVYRSVIDPVILLMGPDKIRHYGVEAPGPNGIVIDLERGIAEVAGTSFDSKHNDNLARALLLRNYGVAYLNQLAVNVEDQV